ncbi:MAG: hypothetical protein ISS72_10190 [Candidatus Brocadiae bacterium]|nr:hypothetical protein [Candidatus Brocadiia bacterium]
MRWSRLRRSERIALAAVAALAVLVGAGLVTLVVLDYGNPQWHRWIYRWQAVGERNRAEEARPADFTGVWTRWSRGGDRTDTPYIDGKRHGRETWWLPSGQKCMELDYEDGMPHGHFRTWYREGQRRAVGYYERGKEHGASTLWYPTGQTWESSTYDHGVRHGRHREWNTQGKLIADGTYRHGKRWAGTFLVADPDLDWAVAHYADGVETRREKLAQENDRFSLPR